MLTRVQLEKEINGLEEDIQKIKREIEIKEKKVRSNDSEISQLDFSIKIIKLKIRYIPESNYVDYKEKTDELLDFERTRNRLVKEMFSLKKEIDKLNDSGWYGVDSSLPRLQRELDSKYRDLHQKRYELTPEEEEEERQEALRQQERRREEERYEARRQQWEAEQRQREAVRRQEERAEAERQRAEQERLQSDPRWKFFNLVNTRDLDPCYFEAFLHATLAPTNRSKAFLWFFRIADLLCGFFGALLGIALWVGIYFLLKSFIQFVIGEAWIDWIEWHFLVFGVPFCIFLGIFYSIKMFLTNNDTCKQGMAYLLEWFDDDEEELLDAWEDISKIWQQKGKAE